MKRVLIIGAGSYVGTSFRQYVQNREIDMEVTAISVRDDSWQKMSFAGFDAVYHTAAIVHRPADNQNTEQEALYYQVNAELPEAIAKKAKTEGVRQFIFLSTAAVYGRNGSLGTVTLIDRNTTVNPQNHYGKSKLQAEQKLQSLHCDGFRVAILRPPMIYGRGCKGNYNSLAALARKLPVFPLIPNQRSMLYIDNLSCLVAQLIEEQCGGMFWPQNREYVNTSKMVEAIAAAHNRRILLIPGFSWALRLLGLLTDKADKAFGSLCYDMSMSEHERNYCVTDFDNSVLETEKN